MDAWEGDELLLRVESNSKVLETNESGSRLSGLDVAQEGR